MTFQKRKQKRKNITRKMLKVGNSDHVLPVMVQDIIITS